MRATRKHPQSVDTRRPRARNTPNDARRPTAQRRPNEGRTTQGRSCQHTLPLASRVAAWRPSSSALRACAKNREAQAAAHATALTEVPLRLARRLVARARGSRQTTSSNRTSEQINVETAIIASLGRRRNQWQWIDRDRSSRSRTACDVSKNWMLRMRSFSYPIACASRAKDVGLLVCRSRCWR